ncbi:hypothetical protein imdm_186 [gamma proteobacterium IMCC2047]|nr:hypothetical protein imdm_186 [gamma proteobacterium IMCC2047]
MMRSKMMRRQTPQRTNLVQSFVRNGIYKIKPFKYIEL